VAREIVRSAAAEALSTRDTWSVPRVPGDLEVDLLTADMADIATAVRGVVRSAERTVTIATADPLSAYRSFVAVVAITRHLSTA
jgi:D-amino peptidase